MSGFGASAVSALAPYLPSVFWAASLAVSLAFVIYGFNLIARWRLRSIPGPPPSWFVGNLPQIVKKGFHITHFEMQQKYGPVMKLFLGRVPVVMVSDPDHARKILLKNADRINPFAGAGLARSEEQEEFDKAGLFNCRAAKAKALRGAWQPTFNPSTLAEYSATMNERAAKLLTRLSTAEGEGKEVNIWRLFGDMTFDVVGSTAFGVEFNTQDPKSTESDTDSTKSLVAACATIFRNGGIGQAGVLPMIGMMMPILVPVVKPLVLGLEKLDMMPKTTKELLQSADFLRSKALSLTAAARSEKEGDVAASKCPMAKVSPAVGSFLHRITSHRDPETKENLSDIAVAAQAFLFMLAGYETTANALAFSMYNVGRFPEVEKRILEEVDSFGRNKEPSYHDIQQGHFKYIEATVNEALRMYPPATATGVRTLAEDTQLGDILVPAKTDVLVNILALHYDEEQWPEPNTFKPERFLKGSPGYTEHHPYAHLPFGAGARQCIGLRFAMEEAIITMVRFFQKYTFELSPGQIPLELGVGTTRGPKDGVFGKVHSRPQAT